MTTPFIAQLLRDLRDAVRSLKKEKKEMEEGIAAAQNALQGPYEQIGLLKIQIAEKEATNSELMTTVKKLQKERVVLRLVIFVCMAVVVGLMCW